MSRTVLKVENYSTYLWKERMNGGGRLTGKVRRIRQREWARALDGCFRKFLAALVRELQENYWGLGE